MPAAYENPLLTHAGLHEITSLVGYSQVLPYAYEFAKDTQVCLTPVLMLTFNLNYFPLFLELKRKNAGDTHQ